MEDPIGRVWNKTEIADGLLLEKTSSPLVVILLIFESRPHALVQIASLAIRSGNGPLLKEGNEAKRSNAILHKVITAAIPDTVGETLLGLVTSREEIPDLLKLHDVIDLVIPRGSNKRVSQIKESTKIPVLGHAGGICHETLLVHRDLVNTGGLYELAVDLRAKGRVSHSDKILQTWP
ncbi:delta 1-pyrroline-5-carboxylate synthetase, putative [Ricinus communis]|uniref:Delta 1-pyrroline-5-carboxylate synthetase, putative n=1 Tax=Ricinus communis TaxID=3988 RepID=B9R6X0_RICCO|nr:delta 1-pyrroline-5-carboxylate synthetase, putative [Ricinus communis]